MKEEFKNNPDFYPTPKKLFNKMFKKVAKWHNIKTILEPSAGSGTLIDYLKEELRYNNCEFVAIENDPALQKELIKKNYTLIDSNFLTYDNSIQADLIFANFPFSNGDLHLLKAIDCLYSGEIVALINAETIKNPYSNSRKELVSKLTQLKADIDYLPNEFVTAERSTKVEVALIHIKKENSIETDLWKDLEVDTWTPDIKLDKIYEVAGRDTVHNLIAKYNREKDLISEQVISFYKNYPHIGHMLCLEIRGIEQQRFRDSDDMTLELKTKLNQLNAQLKKNYWRLLLQEDKIAKNLTSKKKKSLNSYISQFELFAFNEANIKIVINNVLEKFGASIDEAILELFDMLTQFSLKDSRWSESEYQGNIHYYNSWKSNNAYKLNNKVIVRFWHSANVIQSKSLSWEASDLITDISRVVNYFDPSKKEDAHDIINKALKDGQTKKIKVNSLLFTFFKKGTVHIEFTDSEILRKFNISVGKLRGELPMDYAEKDFNDLSETEKKIVKDFEPSELYSVINNYKNNIKLIE